MKLLVRVTDKPEFIHLIDGVISAETVKIERGMVSDTKTLQVALAPGVDPQQVVDIINNLGRIWPAHAWIEKDT